MIALGYLLSLGYGTVCLLFAFLLGRGGLEKRITRKTVHILIGFEWVILYHFHGASVHFLAVCLAFLLLLVVAYKKNLLKMISSAGDNAPGTVYYAVSMSVMAAVSIFEPRFILPFGVAVFATSFGDGFAGLLGQLISKNNPKIFKEKTLVGALANFAFSSGSALVFMLVFPEMNLELYHCLLIGLLAMGVELISVLGLDNILLPLSVSSFTYCLSVFPNTVKYVIPVVLTPLIVMFVQKKNALTRGGVAAALVLDLTVSLTLGNRGFVLLLLFLALGILTDKLKRKSTLQAEEKGSCRDVLQVLSNGFVPMALAVGSCFFLKEALIFAYVAVLAEALGDTAASSLGSHSKNTFDLFKLRRCERGMSGGVSLVGTLSALGFSAVIPLVAFAVNLLTLDKAAFAALLAFIGVVFDSFLGSVFQVKYRCTICNKMTEKKVHCGAPTCFSSGIKFVTNDVVNAVSTAFTAAIAIGLYFYI